MSINPPVSAEERAMILREFPDLADSNFTHPDDPTISAETCIEASAEYRRNMKRVMKSWKLK
jgi:hypothetical protein